MSATATGKTRDHLGRPVVAVTGMGVVTSLGQGVQDNWSALTSGRSGIHRITRFPTDHLRTTIAGTVDFLFDEPVRSPVLTERLAHLAAEEAIAQSKLGTPGDFPGMLFMAVPPVELEWPAKRALYAGTNPDSGDAYDRMIDGAWALNDTDTYEFALYGCVAERTADQFGTRGAPISLSTACASGASAIQLGVEAIRRGDTDAALCIGTDGSVQVEAVVRFSLLSALSTSNEDPTAASRPFSKSRDGFVIAEGAGALVLEDYDAAKARGAEILAVIRGVAEQADDFHRTRSKPDGSPVIGAIRQALADGGVAIEEVDHINAHGTGTPENDKMEAMSLEAVFGEHIRNIPISSNKSMIGHTLTAAGAVEAVISIKTIRDGVIPPTINYENPDPSFPLDIVGNVARRAPVSMVLSNSFGFGGQNACLLIAAEPG
ncbi:beta-ketoacyl-ACP synthase [Kaistia dalseonensis]|uniref:3-oxoacyl-[acyl-carrier-protein] synthase II n=1 Tax=Kaistia dalseonensis TaxID=410840 RepID=A0ABU0H5T8_9HYPH|nr:beta-ketoacyl-ACP synthase [Kaistia dalseonensis]MCX5495091.1 beta-ketoacyl-ACP synthase [Kaistia dalseonensis]MDQ0437673.1 3-oxoacyl-[acyl-carrier-protein] synthase II [Kaistia dalseonensis]